MTKPRPSSMEGARAESPADAAAGSRRWRIHIIGSSPRSGTTLLAEAMATCFVIDQHCEHEESIEAPHPGPGKVYLTKQPGELLSVRLPLLFDPSLHVICCIRDPRDAVVSRHGSRPDWYWCSLRYWKLFIRHYPRLRRHPRVLCVRYEDLVQDPDGVQARIAAFLPFVKQRHRFSEFHLVASPSGDSLKALREVRPIAGASVGNWREHRARVKQQLVLHGSISRSLVELGYESDDGWERDLDLVEPGDFRTKVGEFYRLRYLIDRRLRGVRAAARVLWCRLREAVGSS